MKFTYDLHGTNVVVDVLYYVKPCPMRVTGTGFGDAEPPEYEQFDFSLLNEDLVHDPKLEDLLQEGDEEKIMATYKKKRGLK